MDGNVELADQAENVAPTMCLNGYEDPASAGHTFKTTIDSAGEFV